MKSFLLVVLSFLSVTATSVPNSPVYKGGTFRIGYGAYPRHMLHYLAPDDYVYGINNLVLEPLLEVSPRTGELISRLAKHVDIAPDKLRFTFDLDPRAKFSDGTPVTAADVKFTFDTVTNPKHFTVPYQSYLSSIEKCEAISPTKVRFTAKSIHFKNLEKLAGLFILPAHIYSKEDFNQTSKLIGSGPYTVEKFALDQRVILKRAPQYWGEVLPQNQGRYNFDNFVFLAISDSKAQFEMLKQGMIDYLYFTVSKIWVRDAQGGLFSKNYIKKLQADNKTPFGSVGIYWNLRKELFQDKKVRQALSLYYDRTKLIKQLFYNSYQPTEGLMGINSPYHSEKLRAVPFSPILGDKLLASAGWKKGPDGILRKGDKTFEFELLNNDTSALRHLTIYQDTLRKAGIKMTIRTVDWATSANLIDARSFDAVEIARARENDPSDFGMLWGSDQADIAGSKNISGYKNPEVDKLAAQIDKTFNRQKRITLVKQLDEMITNDAVVTWGWEPTYTRIGYWNKFSFPQAGFQAYSDWRDMFYYWSLDPKKEAALKKAMAQDTAL